MLISLERVEDCIDGLNSDVTTQLPAVSVIRFNSVLHAAGDVTVGSLAVLLSESGETVFGAIAEDAMTAAIQALDICREVDLLAEDASSGNWGLIEPGVELGLIDLDRRRRALQRSSSILRDDMTWMMRRTIRLS
ncbi:hypothetical protein U9M48_026438 [Paspalum notatum var. saurae]|uniref:Uncharacterized protein n=1 Tax=Paspalum notatum var. saurae TaxID=547442 RepID=A0AAQ3TXF6_PASNO